MKTKAMVFLTIGMFAFLCQTGISQAPPKAQLPILTTSAGQSNDANTVNAVMEEADIKYDYCDVPSIEMIQAGVGLAGKQSGEGFHVEVYTDTAKYPKGTPYKTVIIAIGASLKGMGASGLTVDAEEARLKKLVDYFKKSKIFIIGVHVGGEATRGPAGSDNERMIDAVAPFADCLFVTKDSNKDGRFTKIAQKTKAPLIQVDYALGLVELFKKMFL
jgi:hypothetical protein